MYNINIWNCGLLSYGTIQSKLSAQNIWPEPTASIMMACVDRPRMLLQNIHNYVCTRLYGVLTQTTSLILSTGSISNPVPKIIKNWNDRNVTLENWIIEEQYIFYIVFNITYFFHQLCTLLHIMSQKPEETNHFQYKYTFYNQHHICFKLLLKLYHKET